MYGLMSWTHQVPNRDASANFVAVPRGERVPPLILRLTTRWRRLRSSALVVAGTSGSVTTTNRLSRERRMRAHRGVCGASVKTHTPKSEQLGGHLPACFLLFSCYYMHRFIVYLFSS